LTSTISATGRSPDVSSSTTRPDEQLVVPIALDISSQDLPRVIVSGDSAATLLSDPSGFDVRRRGGLGTFVTADQIAARHFMQTIDVFRTIPGVEIDRNGTVAIQRGEISIKKVCAGAQLFVDGVPMAPGPAPLNARDGAKSTAFDINEIPVSSIRGIEIYRGPATTPMVLRTQNTVCGTVAIWTK
jgi:outer membrane receptor for ferrienterochelin and colicin